MVREDDYGVKLAVSPWMGLSWPGPIHTELMPTQSEAFLVRNPLITCAVVCLKLMCIQFCF